MDYKVVLAPRAIEDLRAEGMKPKRRQRQRRDLSQIMLRVLRASSRCGSSLTINESEDEATDDRGEFGRVAIRLGARAVGARGGCGGRHGPAVRRAAGSRRLL